MNVEGTVDHLFRHSAGQMVAALARSLGPAHLDIAEEAVQDALVRALEVWRFSGTPADPRAWLFRVARNRAIDLLRRDASLARKLDLIRDSVDVHGVVAPAAAAHAHPGVVAGVVGAGHGVNGNLPMAVGGDDELAMLFMCCHPAFSRETQVTLTLKTVGGFSVKEIAAAMLARPATIAQRLVRARRTIVERGIRLEMPTKDEVADRTAAVMDVLFLMFNEGYSAHSGEHLVRSELCAEAIRLTRLVCAAGTVPAADALLSLTLLQGSRLAARTDDCGDVVLLPEQDRTQWDRAMIAEGMRALDRSSRGNDVTAFHVLAAIAAAHAAAPTPEATDWQQILSLYDDLMGIAPSSVVAINRAVAVARVHGAVAALADLDRLRNDPAMRHYFPYHAVQGGLWFELGETAEAMACYGRALPLAGNAAEQRFIERRMRQCGEDTGR